MNDWKNQLRIFSSPLLHIIIQTWYNHRKMPRDKFEKSLSGMTTNKTIWNLLPLQLHHHKKYKHLAHQSNQGKCISPIVTTISNLRNTYLLHCFKHHFLIKFYLKSILNRHILFLILPFSNSIIFFIHHLLTLP